MKLLKGSLFIALLFLSSCTQDRVPILIYWEEETSEVKAEYYELYTSTDNRPYTLTATVEKVHNEDFVGGMWRGRVSNGTLLAAKVRGVGAAGHAGEFSVETVEIINKESKNEQEE